MDAALHRHPDAMRRLIRSNVDSARVRWGALPKIMLRALKGLSIESRLSVRSGDLLPLDGRWYVTHTGLLRPGPHAPFASLPGLHLSFGASPRVSPPPDFLSHLKGNARGETRFADSGSGVHIWQDRRVDP